MHRYSGFPAAGHCPGHNLGDVLAARDGFDGALVDARAGPLTNAALLAATAPGALYTYA